MNCLFRDIGVCMCGLGVSEDMGDQGVVTCKTSSKIVLARSSF